MPETFYKTLGYAVWKGGIWYVRRNSGPAIRRTGAGLLLVVAIAGVVVVAQRRNGRAG